MRFLPRRGELAQPLRRRRAPPHQLSSHRSPRADPVRGVPSEPARPRVHPRHRGVLRLPSGRLPAGSDDLHRPPRRRLRDGLPRLPQSVDLPRGPVPRARRLRHDRGGRRGNFRSNFRGPELRRYPGHDGFPSSAKDDVEGGDGDPRRQCVIDARYAFYSDPIGIRRRGNAAGGDLFRQSCGADPRRLP